MRLFRRVKHSKVFLLRGWLLRDDNVLHCFFFYEFNKEAGQAQHLFIISKFQRQHIEIHKERVPLLEDWMLSKKAAFPVAVDYKSGETSAEKNIYHFQNHLRSCPKHICCPQTRITQELLSLPQRRCLFYLPAASGIFWFPISSLSITFRSNLRFLSFYPSWKGFPQPHFNHHILLCLI